MSSSFLAATGSVEVLVACQVRKCLLSVHIINVLSHEPPNSGGIPTQLRLQFDNAMLGHTP